MLTILLLTTVPLLVTVSAWAIGSRRVRDTTVWALVAMLIFDSASIYLGGNYWSHYLVQLIVPVAVIGGVVATSGQPGARLAVATVIASSVLSWSFGMPNHNSDGSTLGHAIGAVTQEGDTIVTVSATPTSASPPDFPRRTRTCGACRSRCVTPRRYGVTAQGS